MPLNCSRLTSEILSYSFIPLPSKQGIDKLIKEPISLLPPGFCQLILIDCMGTDELTERFFATLPTNQEQKISTPIRWHFEEESCFKFLSKCLTSHHGIYSSSCCFVALSTPASCQDLRLDHGSGTLHKSFHVFPVCLWVVFLIPLEAVQTCVSHC